MKKGLLMLIAAAAFTTAAFAYDYDTKVPVPGKTLADGKLQADMLFPVYAYGLRIAAPDCQTFSITDTNITKPKNNGSWEEIWTVKACTRTARIPIKFRFCNWPYGRKSRKITYRRIIYYGFD